MAIELIVEKEKDLSPFTSWTVGGRAEFYTAPISIDELKQTLKYSFEQGLEVTVLGGGTNVLVSDKGVKGLVIHTHKLTQVKVIEDAQDFVIEAEAGAQKSEVLKFFMKQRLQPAIFLAGLPGDMAGGVVMNAGVGHKVSPKEFCEITDSIDVVSITDSGEVIEKTLNRDEIQWDYRKSRNWQPGIITRVRVRWPNQPDDTVLKAVRDGNKRRKSTQPLHQPSCGSVFKNPPGDHAGRLIEASGLKGFTIGGAQVSEKHANFIVNTGNATATDIDRVIKKVEAEVKAQHNIDLTNEVVYLGHWN